MLDARMSGSDLAEEQKNGKVNCVIGREFFYQSSWVCSTQVPWPFNTLWWKWAWHFLDHCTSMLQCLRTVEYSVSQGDPRDQGQGPPRQVGKLRLKEWLQLILSHGRDWTQGWDRTPVGWAIYTPPGSVQQPSPVRCAGYGLTLQGRRDRYSRRKQTHMSSNSGKWSEEKT